MGDILPFQNVAWFDLFQTLFGANTPDWQLTLVSWNTLFTAEGRSNSEMVHAVQAVTRRSPVPRFAPEILDALRSELRTIDRQMRESAESRRLNEIDRPIRCRKCRDVGMITGLPHCQHVDGVNWPAPRVTQATTCDCEMGKHCSQKWMTANKPLMSWLEYIQTNPHWKVQMEMRKLEVDAEVKAHRQQHGAPDWEKIVQRIIQRNSKPVLDSAS